MLIFKEFKAFAIRGNVVDLAIGILIGSAFGKIVTSLVNDIIMPPLGWMLGGIEFDKFALVLEPARGTAPAVLLKYGQFFNTIIDFVLVTLSIFFVIKTINRLKVSEVPLGARMVGCPHCKMLIPVGAKRCGHCTSEL